MNLAATWQWLTTSPLTAITLTVGVYWACDKLWRRTGRHPLLTPILTASALIGVLLLLTGWDYAAYADGTTMITFLLGPATVALGLPLHRQAAKVLEGVALVLGAVLFCGDLSSRALLEAKLFGGSAPFGGSLMIAGWLVVAGSALVARRA